MYYVYEVCIIYHIIILDVKRFGIISWKMSPESTGVFVDGTELSCSFQINCMILILFNY